MKHNGSVVWGLTKDYEMKHGAFKTVDDPYRKGYADGFMRGMKQVLAPLATSASSYDRAFAKALLAAFDEIDES